MYSNVYMLVSTTLPQLFESMYNVFITITLTPLSAIRPDTSAFPQFTEVLVNRTFNFFIRVFGADSTLLIVMLGSGLTLFLVLTLAKWVIGIIT